MSQSARLVKSRTLPTWPMQEITSSLISCHGGWNRSVPDLLGVVFISIFRGNCQIGLYCDSQSLVCIQTKQLGETCDADKEYVSSSI